MDMTGIKVGDRVQVFENYRRGQPNGRDGVVTKVGRKLFTVSLGYCEKVFRLDTGYLNDKQYGGGTYVMTPEQVEISNAMADARSRMRALGLEDRPGYNRLTLDQMLRVIAILEEK